ncbi:DNA polymerase III subunit alpha [Marssonina coronariae]|uniref:DNA polymerase III subunit alpha n=1 Tax=Diplocarpon coronariae TaxID=2795749 RepID=A0A218ZE67_9HELO|nr:DNA polymerase III subunit alpha [Marssonina coronariae]
MEFTNRLRTERRGGYPACPANAASQIKEKKEVAKPNHLKDRCYSSVVGKSFSSPPASLLSTGNLQLWMYPARPQLPHDDPCPRRKYPSSPYTHLPPPYNLDTVHANPLHQCNSRDSKSLVDCQFQTAEQASRHAREVCDACAKDAEYVFVEASEEPKDNDFVLC